ncbi:hypothetical protein R3P38DRAFT_3373941 [Favolaschia claudopus]|uniref:Uncharacterized protein n=1 Tax=Favolaschia claudopus TaxID=2862362 RepID=A0AAV9ZQJ5_9AGAR
MATTTTTTTGVTSDSDQRRRLSLLDLGFGSPLIAQVLQSSSENDVDLAGVSRFDDSERSPLIALTKTGLALVTALAFAVGHHAFFASLDDEVAVSDDVGTSRVSLVARSQAGASAIGTAFAFLVSALLGLSASTAFWQTSWRLVGQRSFTLSGLDALWASPHNALSFFSLDFWRSGREIVLISALAWTFPLVVTFAPGTLTVQTRVREVKRSCSVPTFDFGSSAILHDEVNSASKPYLRPSPAAHRLIGSTLLGGQPFTPTSPCGSNCSYTISANAPSFSCSSGTQNGSALTWRILNPSFNPPPYVGVNLDVAKSSNPYQNWDFEAHYNDYASWKPSSSGNNLTCVTYNSTYHLNYTFIGTSTSVVVDKIVAHQAASQLSSNSTDAANGYFLSPGIHSSWFNATTNYYAVLSSMYEYLIGNITVFETGNSVDFAYTPSDISLAQTSVIDQNTSLLSNGSLTWISFPEIPHAMETLLQNISLSILTGTLDPSQSAQTTCSYRSTLPHFSYDARRLWLVYGAGLLVALFCDLFGVIAIKRNGFGASGEFSDFLAATRNRELNALDLTQRDKVKLRYGPVRSEGGRYAFATPENLFSPGIGEVGRETSDKEEPFLPEVLYDRRK